MAAVPIYRPAVDPRPELRVVTRRKTKAKSCVGNRIVVFTLTTFVVFMASSMLGNVMLEKSRNDGKEAYRRTVAAREYQATLQRQVIALGGLAAAEDWARVNGFVESHGQAASSQKVNRVALNR